MKPFRTPVLILATLGLIVPATRMLAVTDSEAAAGRALVKRYADSIVSVEVVVTIRMTVGEHAMPPRENKVEVNGTVLTPSGLTVAVLSMIDPKGSLEAMRASRGGDQKIEIGETEFKEVKLRRANNTEVPAVIVLKDPDLNLIFIAPLPDAAAPGRTFPCISLDQAATGEVLGNYFFVSRVPKNLQRVPIVRLTTVMGIVEKPRKMFLLTDQALGVPIFDAAGLVLGISTQYLENDRPSGPVVLSAADVAELAAQAAAIKPEEKVEKTETKADTDGKTTAAPPAAAPIQAPAAAPAPKS
ncbi:MAG TPA: hypothetical protein VII09_09325 [Opitutaceae bacterium]